MTGVSFHSMAIYRVCVEEGGRLSAMLSAACHALVNAESTLNLLDTSAGDGDCGSTLARGAKGELDDTDVKNR